MPTNNYYRLSWINSDGFTKWEDFRSLEVALDWGEGLAEDDNSEIRLRKVCEQVTMKDIPIRFLKKGDQPRDD